MEARRTKRTPEILQRITPELFRPRTVQPTWSDFDRQMYDVIVQAAKDGDRNAQRWLDGEIDVRLRKRNGKVEFYCVKVQVTRKAWLGQAEKLN